MIILLYTINLFLIIYCLKNENDCYINDERQKIVKLLLGDLKFSTYALSQKKYFKLCIHI